MIGRLRGELAESTFTSCVVECSGVGYDVSIPVSTFDKLPHTGEQVTLHIHTSVREDAIVLFGFATTEERGLFRALLNVSGIGGKLALNVLSAMPVENFCHAVQSGDIRILSKINGIGKRTAERLIVELKDKLGTVSGSPASPVAGIDAAPAALTAVNDASLALEQLGFKRDHIDKALKQLTAELPENQWDCETLLRKALILLNF